MIQYTLTEYVKLLTEKRFQDIDFTVVKGHIPCLSEYLPGSVVICSS